MNISTINPDEFILSFLSFLLPVAVGITLKNSSKLFSLCLLVIHALISLIAVLLVFMDYVRYEIYLCATDSCKYVPPPSPYALPPILWFFLALFAIFSVLLAFVTRRKKDLVKATRISLFSICITLPVVINLVFESLK
jgi:hypothetical protein